MAYGEVVVLGWYPHHFDPIVSLSQLLNVLIDLMDGDLARLLSRLCNRFE